MMVGSGDRQQLNLVQKTDTIYCCETINFICSLINAEQTDANVINGTWVASHSHQSEVKCIIHNQKKEKKRRTSDATLNTMNTTTLHNTKHTIQIVMCVCVCRRNINYIWWKYKHWTQWKNYRDWSKILCLKRINLYSVHVYRTSYMTNADYFFLCAYFGFDCVSNGFSVSSQMVSLSQKKLLLIFIFNKCFIWSSASVAWARVRLMLFNGAKFSHKVRKSNTYTANQSCY